jgi:hypothetical protein
MNRSVIAILLLATGCEKAERPGAPAPPKAVSGGGLGVHFALAADDERRLGAASGNKAVEILEEIESRWEKDHLSESDKAWNAMHRCLSNGTLDPAGGSPPLNMTVLGGTWIRSEEYIASLLSPKQVREVSQALTPLTEAWFRERYFKIAAADYGPEFGEEDFKYTWEHFQSVRTFFAKAAREGRATLFTTTP